MRWTLILERQGPALKEGRGTTYPLFVKARVAHLLREGSLLLKAALDGFFIGLGEDEIGVYDNIYLEGRINLSSTLPLYMRKNLVMQVQVHCRIETCGDCHDGKD
jgi:hypothetical protein